jgi:hypothetical protein
MVLGGTVNVGQLSHHRWCSKACKDLRKAVVNSDKIIAFESITAKIINDMVDSRETRSEDNSTDASPLTWAGKTC